MGEGRAASKVPRRPMLGDPEVRAKHVELIQDSILEYARLNALHPTKSLHTVLSVMATTTDGYLIARKLEKLGWWWIDAELVAFLDELSFERITALDFVRRKWVADNGIVAEHAVGTLVRITQGRLAGEVRRIVVIDTARARYEVQGGENAELSGVNFEHAVAATQDVQGQL